MQAPLRDWVTWPQARDAWAPGAGRGRKDPPLALLEGASPAPPESQPSGPWTAQDESVSRAPACGDLLWPPQDSDTILAPDPALGKPTSKWFLWLNTSSQL